MMTFDQFIDALDCYGADPAKWPEPLRTDVPFVAGTPAFAAALAAAAEVDRLLTASRIERASFSNVAAQATANQQHVRRTGVPWLAAGAAAALALGVVSGSSAALAELGSAALDAAFDTGTSDVD